MKECEYSFYCPFGSFRWVVIEYDGHHGFACDWEDCFEEINFIDGYRFSENYIDYNDPKLTSVKYLYIEN